MKYMVVMIVDKLEEINEDKGAGRVFKGLKTNLKQSVVVLERA